MLLVNKNLSLDSSFIGDFNLKNGMISKDIKNQFIFTGLQIMKRSFLISEKSIVFSMNKIWSDLIKNKNLYGIESMQETRFKEMGKVSYGNNDRKINVNVKIHGLDIEGENTRTSESSDQGNDESSAAGKAWRA